LPTVPAIDGRPVAEDPLLAVDCRAAVDAHGDLRQGVHQVAAPVEEIVHRAGEALPGDELHRPHGKLAGNLLRQGLLLKARDAHGQRGHDDQRRNWIMPAARERRENRRRLSRRTDW
jgi:hypothetical protein